MSRVNPSFLDEVSCSNEFNAFACMNCGVCTAVCPMGLDLLPRQLFRYVLLGLEDKINANIETIYTCLLCKMCEENCPAEVNITENVNCLRSHINRKVFKL